MLKTDNSLSLKQSVFLTHPLIRNLCLINKRISLGVLILEVSFRTHVRNLIKAGNLYILKPSPNPHPLPDRAMASGGNSGPNKGWLWWGLGAFVGEIILAFIRSLAEILQVSRSGWHKYVLLRSIPSALSTTTVAEERSHKVEIPIYLGIKPEPTSSFLKP